MATPPPDFKDLTLAQVLRLALYHPSATLRRFFSEIALPPPTPTYQDSPYTYVTSDTAAPSQEEDSLYPEESDTEGVAVGTTLRSPLSSPIPQETITPLTTQTVHVMSCGILFMLFFSISLACMGGAVLWDAATDPLSAQIGDTNGAFFWFWVAGLFYVLVSIAMSWRWWKARFDSIVNTITPPSAPTSTPSVAESPIIPLGESSFSSPATTEAEVQPSELAATPAIPLPDTRSLSSPIPQSQNPAWLEGFFRGVERNSLRMALIPVGLILAFLAYSQNVILDPSGTVLMDVRFTRNGTIAWGLAILVWVCLLGLDLNGLAASLYRRLAGKSRTQASHPPTPRRSLASYWYYLVFVLILLIGFYFRFHDMEAVPPEMTSDHIEKLLDAKRVYDGYHAIFFRNNGGREAAQMYFIAALVRYGGLDFSFETIKVASAIEGMATLAATLWLGITVMGNQKPEDRRMGIWLGLSMGAMLAVSSWHTMLSRLGLRISLTAFTSTLVLIFLIRAMRHNRRWDFVMLGLLLGGGMYFYQANRMLPVLVVVGTGLAAIVYSRTWADLMRYAVHLGITSVLAVIIFLPMYRYQQEYPQDFWNRTRGRLFGENAFVHTDPETGAPKAYEPSTTEQIERFADNFGVFSDNYVRALKMWSWRGDTAWINNGRAYPALDPYSNGLLLLGVIAWALLILKKWDVAHLLIPIGILIMLLPSALTLAYTIENPSFTRASGTIPFIFLIAAYPLAQVGYYAEQVTKYRWVGISLGLLLLWGVVSQAAPVNYETYFDVYRTSYSASWKPYHAYAAPLRNFAQGDGSYGNAFMISYPHWLDHRILGTVAGDISWNNGLVKKEDLDLFIQRNAGTPYQYDPNKPLFIMYNQEDLQTEVWLLERFPTGQLETVSIPNRPDLDFKVYRIPPNIEWGS